MDRRIVLATTASQIVRILLVESPLSTHEIALKLEREAVYPIRARLLDMVENGLVRRNRKPGATTRSSRKNPDLWELVNADRAREWLADYEAATVGDTTFGPNPFEQLQAIFGVAVRVLNNLPGRQHFLGVGVTEI